MIDIAFAPLSPSDIADLTNNGVVLRPMNLSNFATQKEAAELRTGDEVVSAGLLPGMSGEWRNFPIFKWGHVSDARGEPMLVPSPCPNAPPRYMREIIVSASLVSGNSGSPIVFLPSEHHRGRAFIVGVQSISQLGSDVAGVSSVRAMLDALRSRDRADMDLGPPDARPVFPQNP